MFNGKSNDKIGTKKAIQTIDIYSESWQCVEIDCGIYN